jgi:hypothetical protein
MDANRAASFCFLDLKQMADLGDHPSHGRPIRVLHFIVQAVQAQGLDRGLLPL